MLASNSNSSSGADKFSKLPLLAKPWLYQICLSVSLDTCKFKGSEKIHLEITKPTTYLKLHSSALDVQKASLKLEDGTVLTELKREIDSKWKLLTVQLPEEVKPQKAELEFVYSGELSTNMLGFYKSTYKDSAGNEQTLAGTQFESNFARCAFPCWDDPTFKAEFDIQLEVDDNKGLTALSNMKAVEEKSSTDETGAAKKSITFARTPPISTYLVAFAVGHFEYVEAKTASGCDVRVYSVPGKKEQGNFALATVCKAFDFFSEWFDFKMPLAKCDVLAMPDYNMGAMENWGLITAREESALYDPTQSCSAHKQEIAQTMAHEVSHFWFGNLVTMKWWTDLWLKEGFASFMEFVFTEKTHPEFKMSSHFVRSEVVGGMSLDSLRSSHPIEVPIENPNELDEIYDSVTYSKSNAIIRMLFNHLGAETFQRALRLYLQRHQYANADTDDLWRCMSEASGIDVKALMCSWTQQMGFPLVTVEERILDGDRRELHLKQSRFLADGGQDEANPVWQVPFGVTTAADPTRPKAKFLLLKPEDKFVLEGVKPNEWVKVNSNFASFFRVQYSQNMLNALVNAVGNHQLEVLDRFQLANDLNALVKSSRVPISHLLDFLNVCQDEEDYFVWSSIGSAITNICYLLKHLDDGRALLDRFEPFVCKMIEPVASKLGWEPKEGEDLYNGRLRALLLGCLSHCRHASTTQMALCKFNDLIERGVNVSPDLRNVIFSTAGRTSDAHLIAALKHLMETCNYSEVEMCCISALGQCSDAKMLEEILYYGVVEGKIRSQDLETLFAATGGASMARCQHVAWDFFKQHFALLLEKYDGVNSSIFQNCAKSVCAGFCSTAMADDVMDFFGKNLDEYSLSVLERPLRQVVECIKLKERQLKDNVADLDEYLHKKGY